MPAGYGGTGAAKPNSTSRKDTSNGPHAVAGTGKPPSIFSAALLHEVFLNPGLFLLFGGILIGYVGRIQGKTVTDVDDPVFVALFQGFLCLFLLEMGMTASKRLKDLKTAGWRFVACALIMPNIFATIGIIVAHLLQLMRSVSRSKWERTLSLPCLCAHRPTSPCQPSSAWRFPRPCSLRCRWLHR